MADYKGIAHICFIEENDTFYVQGYFIDMTSKVNFEVDKDKPRDCFHDSFDPPVYFELTVTNFKDGKEFKEKVEKTGADFAKLSSDHVSFTTSAIKDGEQAEHYIARYFPKLAQLNLSSQIIVCTGEMELTSVEFDPQTKPNQQFRPVESSPSSLSSETEDETTINTDDVDLLDD